MYNKIIYIIEVVVKASFGFPSAESARAVTGGRCPHSGEGGDFLMGQPDFFLRNLLYLRNGKSKNCSQGGK